jgi:hypothetical protein
MNAEFTILLGQHKAALEIRDFLSGTASALSRAAVASSRAVCSTKRSSMPVVLNEWATSQEISNRIDRLRTRYADNPLVKRVDHYIGVDWSDDPAVFINVILPGKEIADVDLKQLAQDIRVDLLRLVRTDEIGLHSYLNFVN